MTKSLSLLVLLILTASAHGQTAMIYDDDGPVGDAAATQNFGVFYKMVDHHWVKPLATIADSGDGLSAPGIHALAVYYRHTDIPLGAYQKNTGDSAWCESEKICAVDHLRAWLANFDPVSGDTRTNYQDCGVLYRKTLAAQPDHSAVIVETGFATCLIQFLGSSSDSYSSLSGKEWNFVMDSSNYSALFSTWRSQNGYPPIYLVGFKLGMIACSGAPADASIDKNPIRNANHQRVPADKVGQPDGECVEGETAPVWDQMAVMYGAWGVLT
jgi:hypothetical protein